MPNDKNPVKKPIPVKPTPPVKPTGPGPRYTKDSWPKEMPKRKEK